LAEDYGRTTRKDFRRFIGNALGSLLELETQLEIACNLEFLPKPVLSDVLKKTRHVAQMLYGLESWCEAEDQKAGESAGS
jgi:four helix bundle protein